MKKYIFLFSLALTALMVTAKKDFELTPEYKLRLAEQIIENFYVEEPDTNKLVEDAIVAMLKTLDPHSSYTSPDETKELTEPLDGNFSGIGVRFQVHNDTLKVIETVSGGPSEAVGILPGDKIIACNDTTIAGVKMKNRDIMKVLRGPKGTRAELKVVRANVTDTLYFNIKRADIPIFSVDASYMVNPTTGYIRMARFAESTTREVQQAMDSLMKKGMENVIIDVTDNGGGYMKPAYEVANMFLKKGDKLVYTESHKNGRADFDAQKDGFFLKGNVVIMANQYSASASEILSGAIQDNDRGVIVGRRTFGKGLVQRPFPFPDGSMMRLTISRYHTPSGRCIQKPYKDGDDAAYARDIVSRLSSGELTHPDSIHMADSLLTHTIRLKRPVYGGGGIVPDVFVPIDTALYTPYYRDIVAKGILASYTFDFTQAHKASIKTSYPTVDDYIKGFKVTQEIYDGLIKAADKEGVKFNEKEFATSREYLGVILKALIARDTYDQNAYFRIANELNPIYVKAVEVAKNVKPYLSKP